MVGNWAKKLGEKTGPKNFDYNLKLEIVTEKTPKTWSKKLFQKICNLYKLLFKIYQYIKIFMKIASSLKSLKKRDLNSKLVRRRGRVYIINKKNPKFKARQK